MPVSVADCCITALKLSGLKEWAFIVAHKSTNELGGFSGLGLAYVFIVSCGSGGKFCPLWGWVDRRWIRIDFGWDDLVILHEVPLPGLLHVAARQGTKREGGRVQSLWRSWFRAVTLSLLLARVSHKFSQDSRRGEADSVSWWEELQSHIPDGVATIRVKDRGHLWICHSYCWHQCY